MTEFPSSAIERICGALNHSVSDVIIYWHTQRARRKMSLIPSALPNVLFIMARRWRVGIVLAYFKKMMLWNLRNLKAEVYFEATRFCIARDQRQYQVCR